MLAPPQLENPIAVQIRKKMVEAISQFSLIAEGDRVLVAVSGGKDSSVMLALLSEIQKRAPYNYTISAVLLDQGHPGFDPRDFQIWVESEVGIPLTILGRDTLSIVKEKIPEGGTYCSLCSRLRRGILYDYAAENGFTKLALGHHRDDLNETLLMNLFFSGRIAAMPPKLRSDDQRNTLIRPMVFVAESEIKELARHWNIPIIPCNLCGSQDNLQRSQMKDLIAQLSKSHPQVPNSMLAALNQVNVSQLMDQRHWDFRAL
jgi:tRNA 2-thiocytidine biosynthesis protein TtcA